MDKIMDMHIHTNFSDGEFSPDETIKRAFDCGISVMAITDHDTVDGLKNVDRNSDDYKNIEFIDGIEINCKSNKGSMHVLGYDFDIENDELNEFLYRLRTNRMNSTLSVMEQIKRDYGIVFEHPDIINLINARSLGRPDLAKLCIKYGFCDTVSEAFDKYLNPAKEVIRGTNKQTSHIEAFKLIKESGGLVVLAHPNSLLLNNSELDSLICSMKELGLDGIEVYHSTFSKEQSNYYKYLAMKYDLLMSGGSDFHGPTVKPDIKLGSGKNNLHIKKLSIVDQIRRR